MNTLFYFMRYLLYAWRNNLLKVFSLTLGVSIGLVLFTQIAFEMSYDKFFPDKKTSIT